MIRKIENLMATLVLVGMLLFAGIFTRLGALAGPAAPPFLTAAAFAVLAGSTVTNTGETVINGDVGVWPGNAITDLLPTDVVGTIHAGDAVAQQAQADLTAAYNDLEGRPCNQNLSGQDLGGKTLSPGVYCFDSSAQLTGALTLNGEGDTNAVFIFKIVSTLTTANNASLVFVNGANACNVYWQVGSSATLGTGTLFAGNILALTSITLNTGATVTGRVLARNGAVTMDTNSIRFDLCLAAATFTPTSTAVVTATETATATPSATATETATATPSATATSTATATPVATGAANATATNTSTASPSSTATTAPTSPPNSAPTSAPTTAPTSAATVTATRAPTVTPTRVPEVVGFPATGGAAPRNEHHSAPQASLLMPTPVQPLNWESIRYLAGTNLYADPMDLPLELWIPSIKLYAPVLGVGITSENVMDAPGGSPEDSVWQKVYWYRGSGIPGDLGTATIAGHVIDILGRPAVFASLKDLKTGNLIIVHDTRNSQSVRFLVVKTVIYTVQQAADLSVLEQIYGIGPVSGKGPQTASDGLSHLTLITCGGDWINGSYDSRLVIYTVRMQATLKEKQTMTGMPYWPVFNPDLIWLI